MLGLGFQTARVNGGAQPARHSAMAPTTMVATVAAKAHWKKKEGYAELGSMPSAKLLEPPDERKQAC